MLTRLTDALRRDPYPAYAVMRRVAPVCRLRAGVWALFDHDSVRRALNDPACFSSRAAPPGGSPLDWLIFLDPPRHSRLRALIARTFTPRAVAALEPQIDALAHRLLDVVIPRGECDLVTDFSAPLPALVIVALLGVPDADAHRVGPWGDAIIGLGETVAGGERAARAAARYRAAKEEMQPYLAALLDARRAEPRDDLLTRLVQAEVDGERLTEEEIFGFFQLLLLAGTETTTNLISNTVLCLLRHPAQRARLDADMGLLPAALEEVLRYRSPVQMVFRATTNDVTLRGRTIPAGQLVLAMVGSANRDPRHFPAAGRFDITRAGQPHVGFGHGPHYCIGAALARLEARVALTALFSRAGDLRRRDRDGWLPARGINVHGPRSLRVRFTPVAAPRR
jgi:cytochrome P450